MTRSQEIYFEHLALCARSQTYVHFYPNEIRDYIECTKENEQLKQENVQLKRMITDFQQTFQNLLTFGLKTA